MAFSSQPLPDKTLQEIYTEINSTPANIDSEENLLQLRQLYTQAARIMEASKEQLKELRLQFLYSQLAALNCTLYEKTQKEEYWQQFDTYYKKVKAKKEDNDKTIHPIERECTFTKINNILDHDLFSKPVGNTTRIKEMQNSLLQTVGHLTIASVRLDLERDKNKIVTLQKENQSLQKAVETLQEKLIQQEKSHQEKLEALQQKEKSPGQLSLFSQSRETIQKSVATYSELACRII